MRYQVKHEKRNSISTHNLNIVYRKIDQQQINILHAPKVGIGL